MTSNQIALKFCKLASKNGLRTGYRVKHNHRLLSAVVYNPDDKNEVSLIIRIFPYKIDNPDHPLLMTRRMLNMKKFNTPILVIGGIEQVETAVQTIKRDIKTKYIKLNEPKIILLAG